MGGLLDRWRRFRREVLGINARNLSLVYPLNPRREMPLADDKLLAKTLFERAGVPAPRTLAVFEKFSDLPRVDGLLEHPRGFVVKPASASGGNGILVVRRSESGELVSPGPRGEIAVGRREIREHVCQILSGMCSPSRVWERAFAEELVEADEVLGSIGVGGLPDLRVLVHRGEPVMAMLRVPTRRSRGKANLHQGAVGLGIDMESGRTTGGILGIRRIDEHPDTGTKLRGIAIPHWPEVLRCSRRAAECVDLGYLGVDVVIDRERGPMVIEVNARPGLNIQLANGRGLRSVLAAREAS